MSDTTPPPAPEAPAAPAAPGFGPVGTVRSPIVVILLTIITFGIYSLFWTFGVFKDLKNHTGNGIGGGIALLIAIVISPVNLFLLPAEIGAMYAQAGKEKPVSGITGLWNLLPIVGSIIWLFKVQGAMNARWTGAA